MAYDPWIRGATPRTKASGAVCVARMVFLLGMGAAVWMATFWAAQIWN